MRNRGRRRGAGRRLASVGGKALGGNDILTITDSGQDNGAAGTLFLVTTAAPHGLAGTEIVMISGSSVPNYNTGWALLEAPTTTTFVANNSVFEGNATGGTWSIA